MFTWFYVWLFALVCLVLCWFLFVVAVVFFWLLRPLVCLLLFTVWLFCLFYVDLLVRFADCLITLFFCGGLVLNYLLFCSCCLGLHVLDCLIVLDLVGFLLISSAWCVGCLWFAVVPLFYWFSEVVCIVGALLPVWWFLVLLIWLSIACLLGYL